MEADHTAVEPTSSAIRLVSCWLDRPLEPSMAASSFAVQAASSYWVAAIAVTTTATTEAESAAVAVQSAVAADQATVAVKAVLGESY